MTSDNPDDSSQEADDLEGASLEDLAQVEGDRAVRQRPEGGDANTPDGGPDGPAPFGDGEIQPAEGIEFTFPEGSGGGVPEAGARNTSGHKRSLRDELVNGDVSVRGLELTLFPTYPTATLSLFHIGLTVFAIASGVGVYILAALGNVPQYVWIIALPLFSAGVFGLLPILGWLTGIWNPSNLH